LLFTTFAKNLFIKNKDTYSNIMVEHISKIDTSRRISLSPKILKFLEAKKGDYVLLIEEDEKIVLYKTDIGIAIKSKSKES